MIRFRSLYEGDHCDEIVDIPCRYSKLICGMVCEIKDSTDSFLVSNDSFRLTHTVSKRHCPQYSIHFTTSMAMGEDPTKMIRKLCRFRPYVSGETNPETAVSPVAIFQGRMEGSYVRWRLIGAGLIQTLNVNNSFDEFDGSLTDVELTLLDLRLETDFLQSVDVKRMNPDWKVRSERHEEQQSPRTEDRAKVHANRHRQTTSPTGDLK